MPAYKEILAKIEGMLTVAGLEAKLSNSPRLASTGEYLALDYIFRGTNGNLLVLQDLQPVVELIPLQTLYFIEAYTGIYPIENLPADCGLKGKFQAGLTVVHQPLLDPKGEVDMEIMPNGQVNSCIPELLVAADYSQAVRLFINEIVARPY